LKKITASQLAMPSFVPPKQSTSTPACHVAALGGTPSDALALAKRARHLDHQP